MVTGDRLRIGTFNLENLGSERGGEPSLADRIALLRPQLLRLEADILCLQEVNPQAGPGSVRHLAALDALLAGTPYAGFDRAVTMNPAGTRIRDVQNQVILSRWPIRARHQIWHDLIDRPLYRPATANPDAVGPEPLEWDRPALAVEVAVTPTTILHLFGVHLRAPSAAFIPGQKQAAFAWRSAPGWAEGYFLAALRRSGQALEVRVAVDRVFDNDPGALIAICGDFNADASEVPVTILRAPVSETGNPHLAGRVLVPLEPNLSEARRFTVIHGGAKRMLDHIMVSRGLLGMFESAEVHNELLADELETYRAGLAGGDSFHAPVVATFRLPAAPAQGSPNQ